VTTDTWGVVQLLRFLLGSIIELLWNPQVISRSTRGGMAHMRIGVLGTGVVGQALSGKMAELGNEVMVGTRDVDDLMARTEGQWGSPPFSEWLAKHHGVEVGTFAQAARHGELVFNATNGQGTLEALEAAGEENLSGKVVVDVSNPLDFSAGMPPTLFVCNTDSLAEQIQRAFPQARVVKTLNTVNANVMVDPNLVADGDHHVFVSGDDQPAKDQVISVLKDWFGWKNVLDLGDLTTARGPEMYLALWLRFYAVFGSPMATVKVVR
jgi:predicted dinucleotide-binding enzyme